MVRKIYTGLVGCLLLLPALLAAQEDTIAQRIVLIGDAGQLTNGRHPVVDAVRKLIPLEKKTTVLFLGDNLYKNGLPDDQAASYKTDRAVLDSQLSVADGTPAKVIMIPGNHDWQNGGRGGYDAIIRQQLYVDIIHKQNAEYWPKDGCPGPVEISLGNDVTLILFDSQWWLHPHDKPEIESDCACKTQDELVSQIRDIAARNTKKLVILACHHPFKSNGMHGGYYTFIQHLFPLTDLRKNLYIPLPVIGSAYPIARSVFGTPQDIKHPVYTNMINQVSAAAKSAPNIVFVSGHDHNLQHIKDSNYNYIVSGGGCKQNRTSKNKNSLYNNTAQGFGVMEVSKNKNVTLSFYVVTDSTVVKDYTSTLFNFSSLPELPADPNAPVVTDPVMLRDSFTIAASREYPPISGLKKFFMGENYRAAWSEPVTMRVLKIKNEKGGMAPIEMGGGTQTKSLRLRENKTGREWVLRSMNKSPGRALPDAFQSTFAKNLVSELNSAAYPYGALVFPELAKPLQITVAKPELVFVPDDPALGFWRPLFANTVCMFEPVDAPADGSDTKTTAKLLTKMLSENDHLPDQQMVLRARLLDMLTGDFDRHFDQWRWGTIDTGKGKVYYPIPRDRDQAFFHSDGAVLRAVSNRALPFLKGFRHDMPKSDWLNYSARDFDRLFLTDLDRGEWESTVQEFRQSLTDSSIRHAIRQLPPEVYKLDGESFTQKLISRREILPEKALKYYEFLSRKVNVVGSNQREFFKVSNYGAGLQVRVYAITRGSDTGFIMYNRIFNPSVTKEIRLYGLNDDDVFLVEENAKSRIKLRIIGGKGYDTFDVRGQIETLLYDQKATDNVDLNYIKNSHRAKNRFSLDPPVNERSILGFEYNTGRFPRLHVNYNTDDGWLLGGGFSKRTYGFRNLPYATDQRMSLLGAPDHRAWQVNYKGEFNHITRDIDLLVRAYYASPALRNFLGYGNHTVPAKDRGFAYYRIRYQALEGEVLIRKRMANIIQLMGGPAYAQYNISYNKNAGGALGNYRQLGIDSASFFGKKTYAGLKFALTIDNRNKEFFPTRGIYFHNELSALAGIGNQSRKVLKFTSDMTIYASLREPAKAVAVLKAGLGRIFTKQFDYFQALTLGAETGLNGFRKNRFTGSSMVYGSLEFKFKLFDINSFFLPGSFGINTFYNIARMNTKGVPKSKNLHGAYGAGVYYMPFNMFAISATAGFSEDEKMFNFTLGTRINLTY